MKLSEKVKLLEKALKLAAMDYYRGCKLAEGQEETLYKEVVERWMEEADGK